MSLKSWLFLQYSKFLVHRERRYHENAIQVQEKILFRNIAQSQNSEFGRDHHFNQIQTIEIFQNNIPLRHYEDFSQYLEKIKRGEAHILQKNKPLYLLMTSGTSSGTKYIPLSKSGIQHQINAALKLLCFYAVSKKNAGFMDYKMIFLQGSPVLSSEYNIPSGRLSGVVYHHVPRFFQKNKLPKYETNIITNWQEKVDNIVDETVNEDISILGGIPPWCIQYFEKLRKKSGKNTLKETFPHLTMYIHGGLDFSSYRENMMSILGNEVDCLQTFPASEGFFGIQDRIGEKDMLLLLNQGIFYEFIPMNEVENINPKTKTISDIEINTSYELVITNDSGLWRYRMGDLIQFTGIAPYRIQVVGRTSQFISAFGEHVIGVEIERTMAAAIVRHQLKIEDYHVSPNMNTKQYEWRIEWKELPSYSLEEISMTFDEILANQNSYYSHLIKGQIIQPATIISLPNGSFSDLRKKMNKEGGQNKVIRLSNESIF